MTELPIGHAPTSRRLPRQEEVQLEMRLMPEQQKRQEREKLNYKRPCAGDLNLCIHRFASVVRAC